MSKKLALAAAVALLTVAAPARAAIIQWNLDGVHVTDNPSMTFTGFLDYDTVANAGTSGSSANYNITEFVGGAPSFTWSLSNSGTAFGNAVFTGPIFEVGSLDSPQMFLGLTGNLPFDGSVSTIPLIGSDGTCDTSYFVEGACATGLGLSGSLVEASVSAAPLPAALPLFGSGVIALAGFAWQRRGKVSVNRQA
jgi:hypothetical protein